MQAKGAKYRTLRAVWSIRLRSGRASVGGVFEKSFRQDLLRLCRGDPLWSPRVCGSTGLLWELRLCFVSSSVGLEVFVAGVRVVPVIGEGFAVLDEILYVIDRYGEAEPA